MKTKEETLDLALEAFWAKVAELHPERETGDLDPTTVYDLEVWAGKALDTWLEMNQPVFYVHRTVTQIIRVVDATNPEEAEDIGRNYGDPEWFTESLDTQAEYWVTDRGGNLVD